MNAAPGRLYVVATPLGNLEDLSPRAVRVLREVALVACEDTRRTATLLRTHGLSTPTISYFEHNERERTEPLLDRLRAGQDIALVSDAGTPGISDPGFRVVRAARAAGLPVLPVPGPSAAITALSVSGLPTDRFVFLGFLPARAGARARALEDLRALPFTLVLYESPLRIVGTLQDLAAALGTRRAFLCREATKLHEEYLSGSLPELTEGLRGRAAIKGECTLVIEGASGAALPLEGPVDAAFRELVAGGLTRRAAVKELARRTGRPARELYGELLDESS